MSFSDILRSMRDLADIESTSRHYADERTANLIQVVRSTAFEHFVPPRDAQGCGA